MTTYVVALLKFSNESLYRRYQARFHEVFAQFQGRLLSADEHPTVLEGKWDSDKVVLMEFPTEEAALSMLRSPAYQQISEDRKAGADTLSLMIKGL